MTDSIAASASIPSAYAGVTRQIPEGLVWSYKATIRGKRLYHQWELVGERGGIHVSAWYCEETKWSHERWLGGIEAHSPISQSDYGSQEPSHEHCWLIGAPCWHDGSSLQFSEQIAPMLPYHDAAMGEYEHGVVLGTMLHRYEIWLPTAQAIEARRVETAQTSSIEDESAVAKPCANTSPEQNP